jgi:hypothetical protein
MKKCFVSMTVVLAKPEVYDVDALRDLLERLFTAPEAIASGVSGSHLVIGVASYEADGKD